MRSFSMGVVPLLFISVCSLNCFVFLFAHFVATCPNCSFGKAAFIQIQLRSADEPATTFYKCMNENCRHSWRED